MISKDILKKIKKIEITARHLVDTTLKGEYLSSFKGRGMEFAEVREYAEGDDIRAIDWNVTARMNAPYVKNFIEERELQVFFAADMSGSLDFGSREQTKKELMLEFVTALAFAAVINNDRTGFLGFSSQVEKYIAPKKGRRHVMRIAREIIYHKPRSPHTDLNFALRYMSHLLKKRSTIFVISDFYDKRDILESLKILRHRHDVIAVVLRDRRDHALPDLGLVPFTDPETGDTSWVDTSDRGAAVRLKNVSEAYDRKLEKLFKSAGIDTITLSCGEPYIKTLAAFFKQRTRRRFK